MKFLVCLLVTLGVAFGAILPLRPDCRNTFCTMDLKICPDGTPAPIPVDGCCPSLKACGTSRAPRCALVMCTMDLKICPDGTPAPVPAGECCPSLRACHTGSMSRRSNSLGSLLSGTNVLQSLTTATHGTDLGTALSILKLLNNVQKLSNDVHQIPLLVNQTLVGILNGTGQASQIVIDQLIGTVANVNQQAGGRDLLGAFGQNANLLSSITHTLPQGTSIATVLSILKLLNSVNQLNSDVHQVPVLLNQTLANLVGGAGQATDVVVQQLLSLVQLQSQTGGRDLLGAFGQNVNLLSSITHTLPPGTSIATVLSILKLLNSVNQLNSDVHQVPLLINQTLANLVGGAGQASDIVVQQLLSLVQLQSQISSRDLLGAFGQNANLFSTVSQLLPQGTSISTVFSLLKLLNNVNALNNDLHQVPVVLQQTLQNILNGVQNV